MTSRTPDNPRETAPLAGSRALSPQPISRTTPYLVWGAGLVAYILAIANRSSFGVAGLAAADRFGVSSTVLSLFVVVQISLYGLMQLPAGMALDLWGPRRLIAIGTALMALGQLAMAFAPTVQLAIAARVLIGTGDATIFVSVVRLIWNWFPAGRAPLFTQLTSVIGQAGQVISAFPFAAALRSVGWSTSFAVLAAAGLGISGFSLTILRNGATAAQMGVTPSSGFAGLGVALRNPGTWLGFFCHMMGAVSSTVFLLMWGVPFMRQGLGYPEATASAMLTVVAATSIFAGPIIGQLTSRRPNLRVWIVLGVGAFIAAAWAWLLIPHRPVPLFATVLAVMMFSIGGSSSLLALDIAASYNSPARRSSAQGLANMGGFLAAVPSMLTIGAVLDSRTGGILGVTPTHADYRAALSIMFIPLALAAIGILVTRKAANHRAALRPTH